LGEFASEERFATIRPILDPVKAISVKALVANEALQTGLVEDARKDALHRLMEGFIGECKAMMNSLQQSPPAQSIPQPKSERQSFVLFVLLASAVLQPLDRTLLVSPVEVLPFGIHKDQPPFCAEEGWLESCVEKLAAGLAQEENDISRVCPGAFIRCSRGGKTRVLRELNRLFKARFPHVAVVYISFNDFSSLQPWEMHDPLGALCRRIAFSALKDRDETWSGFGKFRLTDVRESDIRSWLGATPCLLLIDELNVVELDRVAAMVVTSFLKECFLFTGGRYFAFSSHVVPAGRGLTDFMDSVSERGIVIHQLPLIPSMKDARRMFQWPDLTVRQALFRARVPALISYTRGTVPRSFDKRQAAIDELFRHWNDTNVKELLGSFLDGQAVSVPQPLLQLMTVAAVQGQGKIVWIPFHMTHVLQSISGSAHVDRTLRAIVTTMNEMFVGFETGKISGGDSWEAMFAIALVIRLVTRSFHRLLGLDELLISNALYGLSYNCLWEAHGNLAFPDITTLGQLIEGLVDPPEYPHVAVYYPPHARFETYDLIVVWHQAQNRRIVHGYQLKEGREIPRKMSSDICKYSCVIRGFAAQEETLLRGWHVASDDEIESFLGITGSSLAPKQWRALAQ
jgi:hypothetical protein